MYPSASAAAVSILRGAITNDLLYLFNTNKIYFKLTERRLMGSYVRGAAPC